MKSPLVFLLVLILCYLCRAQTTNTNNDNSVEADKSGEEQAQILRPTAEAEGGQQAQELQPDIWAEVRYLRDMVVEQKVELRHLTARVTAAERLVEELMTENTAMEARMTTAENLVEELQRDNNAQATELAVTQQSLSSLQQRLTISENQVEELEKQLEGQRATVQELQNTNTVKKVAFSASLLTSGEGNTENTGSTDPLNLIYRNVITNIGNCYNPNTGYFSAPVRGVYYFRFTGHVAHFENSMKLDLIKNGTPVMIAGDRHTTSEDGEDNASNGAVLQLEAGDVVSVQLGGSVWDDQYHRTTFSGFLLFPV